MFRAISHPIPLCFYSLVLYIILFPINLRGEHYTFAFNDNDFIIETINGETCVSWQEEKTEQSDREGQHLPSKIVRILAPKGMDVDSIIVKTNKTIIATDCLLMDPEVSICNDIEGLPTMSTSNPTHAPVEVLPNIHGYEGFGLKYIRISPLQYVSSERALYLSNQIDIEVKWKDIDIWKIRSTVKDINSLLNLNVYHTTENLNTYYDVIENANITRTLPLPTEIPGHIQYLIITTKDMAPAFKELAKWRTSTGVMTEVVTIESLGIDLKGEDAIFRLKDYIYSRYREGVYYVMLAGNTDIIPTANCECSVISRNFYNEITDITFSVIPCDGFYASFDNDFYWDANGNGRLGEPEDDIDFAPDMVVSRLPVNSVEEAFTYAMKVYMYEYYGCKQHKDTILLMTGSEIDTDSNPLTYRSDAHYSAYYIYENNLKKYWPYKVQYLFDTGDIKNRGFTRTDFIYYTGRASDYVFINAHGNQSKIQTQDDDYITSVDIEALDNVLFPFHCLMAGCYTSRYTNPDCLAKSFLISEGGAVDYIGSADYSFARKKGYPSTVINHLSKVMEDVFRSTTGYRKKSMAETLKEVKADYAVNCVNNGDNYTWTNYSLNLLGDPLVLTYVGGEDTYAGKELKVEITKDEKNSTVTVSVDPDLTSEQLIIYVDYSSASPKATMYRLTKRRTIETSSAYTVGVIANNYRPFLYQHNVSIMLQ